jgi:hypothetical protein
LTVSFSWLLIIRSKRGSDNSIITIVLRWFQTENLGHHIIEVDVFERLDHNASLERGALRDKSGSHRRKFIVITVAAAQPFASASSLLFIEPRP